MDEERKGANGVLREVLGDEKTDKIWESFRETLAEDKGYWSNTLVRRDSMGYSPEED